MVYIRFDSVHAVITSLTYKRDDPIYSNFQNSNAIFNRDVNLPDIYHFLVAEQQTQTKHFFTS